MVHIWLPAHSDTLWEKCRSLSEEWRDGIESETGVSGLLKGSQKELGVVSDAGSGDRIFHYI